MNLHLEKLQTSWERASQKKQLAPEEISDRAQSLRQENLSIVTINGSFDLLHAGHLHMLYEASQLGDILIVALNTDDSIQRYKSAKRPIISLKYRLQMLSALSFVDFVTFFDETDPREILKKIRPSIHVNGSEYGENCIEAETVRSFGGRVHIVKLMPSLSTSLIIQKIQQCDL